MKKGLLFLLISFFSLTACSSNNEGVRDNENSNAQIASDDFGKESIKLSFKTTSSYEYLSTIKNKEVTINGYMATSSPVDGSFIFLMNLPYQNCPFCKPNTNQLSNTIEVYPKSKEKFSYTSSAIKIVGTLIVAEDINKPFTDPFDYEFVFKIVDAEYRILKDSDLPEELGLWQKFANTTLITDIYKMFDYIDFVCNWPSYFVNSYEDKDGNIQKGYYLWPGDAEKYIKNSGASYNYGYKEGYFERFITRLNKISATGFEPLIKIINDAKELAEYALKQLDDKEFTYEEKYVEKFDTIDKVFTLNDNTLTARADSIYYAFSNWLSNFEM